MGFVFTWAFALIFGGIFGWCVWGNLHPSPPAPPLDGPPPPLPSPAGVGDDSTTATPEQVALSDDERLLDDKTLHDTLAALDRPLTRMTLPLDGGFGARSSPAESSPARAGDGFPTWGGE